MTNEVNHGTNFRPGHTIHGFPCGIWRHRSIVGVQPRICLEVHLWIVELSIQLAKRESLFPAFSDDTQDCCGVLQFRIPRITLVSRSLCPFAVYELTCSLALTTTSTLLP